MKRAEQYSQSNSSAFFQRANPGLANCCTARFPGSLDMLVHYADSLGLHTEIRTKTAPAEKRSPGTVTWASKKKARAQKLGGVEARG